MRREAAELREQWLGRALSTLPADRPAAEAAISELYHLIGLTPPRFHWVTSPVAALVTVPPGVRARESVDRLPDWPLPARFSALVAELWRQLNGRIPPRQRSVDQLIRQEIRYPLSMSVANVLHPPLRAGHDGPFRQVSGWYSTQCPSWVAEYEALHLLAGVAFSTEQRRLIGLWATLAGSCGWWWPRPDVCVVSERPALVHTEQSDDDGRVRLHCADGPAIGYADGWDLYAWHGTTVPAWVIRDPSVTRIAEEANVEVRRCAIERIGWGAYIEQAGLRLVSAAPDPGNPGFELRLYDMRRETKVLLAVNGSLERDGTRRRYGLTVPGWLDDPIAAAGWTYGLSGEQYSRLLRRT